MKKSYLAQIKLLFKQTSTMLVMFFMFVLVFLNCLNNIIEFQGSDVNDMLSPMIITLISFNRGLYSGEFQTFFIEIYPLIVVLAAGLNYAKERKNGTNNYIVSRIGKEKYLVSKMLAVFSVTFLVFTIPLIAELVINMISFPGKAIGGVFNGSYYNKETIDTVSNFPLGGLFMSHPRIYAFLFTVIFGVLSGLLGAFTVATTELCSFKYRILYALPVVVMLNATFLLAALFPTDTAPEWYAFYMLYTNRKKIWGVFAVMEIFILSFIFFIAYKRKDSDTIENR